MLKFSDSYHVTDIFNEDTVLDKLLKLKPSKSSGPDSMHPHELHACAHAIAKPLTKIFTRSYECGVLPSDWKLANVTPVYKKGSRNQTGNYRPISLTSVPCKMMESLLEDKMTAFLDDNQILSKYQHGFIKGRSCLTNLLRDLRRLDYST